LKEAVVLVEVDVSGSDGTPEKEISEFLEYASGDGSQRIVHWWPCSSFLMKYYTFDDNKR